MSDLMSPDMAMTLINAQQGNNALEGSKKAQDALRKTRDMEKIDAAAQDFEALFIAEMMRPMFDGISTEAPFGGGKGEEVFRGMMLQEYGKIMAQTGSIGVAGSVKEAMIRMQDQADNASMQRASIEAAEDDADLTDNNQLNVSE